MSKETKQKIGVICIPLEAIVLNPKHMGGGTRPNEYEINQLKSNGW